MVTRFVALLVLVVFPIVYFGSRLTSGRSRVARAILFALALLLAVLEFPSSGGTWTELRRATLLVSASIVAFAVVQYASGGRMPNRPRRMAWLGLTSLAALVVYLNFFQFHGPRVSYFHPHEFAHYYLGSKYAAELDYPDLYAAMVRAEADDRDGQVASRQARDLASDRLVPVDALAAQGAEIKARFVPTRWDEFRQDVRHFRRSLERNYPQVLADHGYNASPLWSLIGGGIANATSASDRTFRFLGLLDVAIFASAALAVVRVLGVEALCLAVIYVCIAFGAEFGWVGGGYLRQMWFGAVVGFALCLSRRRYGWAGALLGFAAMLRLFPGFFAIGTAACAISAFVTTGRLPSSYKRFFVAFGATAVALLLLTGLYPGFDRWAGFFQNTQRHAERVGFNSIGVSQSTILLFGEPLSDSPAVWLDQVRTWRDNLATTHLFAFFLPALILAFVAARRLNDLSAAALGAPLLLCGLNLAGFYYTFVVVVVLAFRDQADKLAWLFGAELAIHALHLFEPETRTLHLYKGLVLLYALVAVYWPTFNSGLSPGARSDGAPHPPPARE
jgi:hypothetical protein